MTGPAAMFTAEQRRFLADHRWAILATGRRDGSPQQSMVGYWLDDHDRIVISVKRYTAKWHNAVRNPGVCLTIPDGRANLTIYANVETIADDPLRAELTADVFAALSATARPDPASIVDLLDQQQRSILRLTPHTVLCGE